MRRLMWLVIALVLIYSAWSAHVATPGAAFILALLALLVCVPGLLRLLRVLTFFL